MEAETLPVVLDESLLPCHVIGNRSQICTSVPSPDPILLLLLCVHGRISLPHGWYLHRYHTRKEHLETYRRHAADESRITKDESRRWYSHIRVTNGSPRFRSFNSLNERRNCGWERKHKNQNLGLYFYLNNDHIDLGRFIRISIYSIVSRLKSVPMARHYFLLLADVFVGFDILAKPWNEEIFERWIPLLKRKETNGNHDVNFLSRLPASNDKKFDFWTFFIFTCIGIRPSLSLGFYMQQ